MPAGKITASLSSNTSVLTNEATIKPFHNSTLSNNTTSFIDSIALYQFHHTPSNVDSKTITLSQISLPSSLSISSCQHAP